MGVLRGIIEAIEAYCEGIMACYEAIKEYCEDIMRLLRGVMMLLRGFVKVLRGIMRLLRSMYCEGIKRYYDAIDPLETWPFGLCWPKKSCKPLGE